MLGLYLNTISPPSIRQGVETHSREQEEPEMMTGDCISTKE